MIGDVLVVASSFSLGNGMRYFYLLPLLHQICLSFCYTIQLISFSVYLH